MFFRSWQNKDHNCKGLEEVRGLEEDDRVAWFLGLKGDFPGCREGIKTVKEYLVGCWDKTNGMLELEGNRRN